ncbi:type IV pilus biogenesis/stability protein PilW [Ketobacter sp. MCCC 1A13808]|uniref:type IV pilus biogenesis/stability protein PilW n=1 Tax=Ketobacter sp. MCCC 1A13808 TaxID=2602738 RepID=UPI0012EC15C7|nr:type IV pilus biogenesis/stability protein PilW [Ketobacter sp. MCCC 1A13808]MVF14547.1 type IV pilus biogenesis/stability protein PilW [Ketobacter sp. MCCC 1A13808]
MRLRNPLKIVSPIVVVVCVVLSGCVTETNDPLAQNKDPAKAVKTYVEAATRYMQLNQMANADRTLKRAHEIAPDDPAVNNALALFYTIEGEDEQVERYYKKALSGDQAFSQARNNYASYLYRKERYQDAIDQLEKVAKDYRYQRRYTAFENLGVCYLKVGEREDARKAFNRALQLNTNMPVSTLELAELALEDGDNQLTERYLRKYEKIAPSSPKQLWIGIRLQRRLGDKDKVASYALALKSMFPGSDEYKAYKASL